MAKEILTGMVFGKITMGDIVGRTRHRVYLYKCKCDCGNTFIGEGSRIKRGIINSCGCLRRLDINKKYGYLRIIKHSYTDSKGTAYYECVCDCGNKKTISGSSLGAGRTRSCGCYKIEKTKTHGKTKTRLYKKFNGMKTRCYYKDTAGYKYYGAKGVTICKEWLEDFNCFYDWAMNTGYKDGLTIDRINPYGNYEPSNCRWATYKEQANNKRKHYES